MPKQDERVTTQSRRKRGRNAAAHPPEAPRPLLSVDLYDTAQALAEQAAEAPAPRVRPS